MNNQKGFTLIELVVVIVILGILSAVAVPKFVDLQDDAYEAKIKASRGAFKAGISMIHAKSLVSGVGNGTPYAWLDLNGNSTTSWADGDVAVQNSWPYTGAVVGCVAIFNNLVDDDIKVATNTTEDFQAVFVGGVCTYTDVKSADSWNFAYTIADGSVSQLVKP